MCPKGRFNPFYGQGMCFKCPNGTMGTDFAAESNQMTRVSIDISCETCPVGKYQDKMGQPSCKSCATKKITKQLWTNTGECLINTDDSTSYCGEGEWKPYPDCKCICKGGHALEGTKCSNNYDPCNDSNGGEGSKGDYEPYCIYGNCIV